MSGRGGHRGGARGVNVSALGLPAQRQVTAFLIAEREQARLKAVQEAAGQKPKHHKYGARRTKVDGISFASGLEAKRYAELKRRVAAGIIANLELQPRYPLEVKGRLVTTYIADFRYIVAATGAQVVEDTKGFKTPEYLIKKALAEALHDGLEIVEVTSWRA